MKKLCINLVLFLLIFIIGVNANAEIRGYDSLELPKGTLIPVINTEEFSTVHNDDTTKLQFISTNDIFMFDSNIIPRGTVFFGYIEKMNEPVIGTNASLVIKINKLRLVDGFEIPLKAYIYSPNNNVLGGGMTAPEKYEIMPHYQKGFKNGTAQWVAGPKLKMGSHFSVAAGTDLLIVLVAPAIITHTLTN